MMCVSKNFEDKIGRGENPLPVYARILEKTPTGTTIHRTDLSAKIEVYSGDNQLIVQDGGMKNGYKTALVSADKDTLSESGLVTFKFVGKDGTFIEHMKFKILQPTIYFGQENIGLPAHYEKEVELHFSLLNMPDDAEAKAEIISPGNKKIYDVHLTPDDKLPRFYSVKFKDISLKDEADAGTTERHVLRITATITDPKTHQTREVKNDFEIFRIHMGLVLKLEADAVGCYLLMKDGENEIMRQRAVGSDLGANLATPMAALDPSTALTSAGLNAMKDVNFGTNVKSHDVQPNYTTGRILLFFWDEEKQEIMRVPVVPKKEVEIRAISVGNDKNSLIGEASERHQKLVKALEIKAYATKDIDDKGMRLVKICSTKAGLDQPTRIRAEITFKATYLKKEYEVKKKVLLHSMPFRKVETPEQWKAYTDYDAKIQEQLERVKAKLGSSNKLENYLPLYNLIDRMLKGYDFSFGYDRRQVERVMSTWIRIVQGKLAGMNEEAEKVTLADDIAAIYAFMQGMRDNGGLLGRIALGFCTYGYSEYLFFAMDLGEKMQAAVYACKGDKEFGFWDGVKMGIEEYEKQLAMELLLAGANVGMGKIHAKFHGGYEKDMLGSIANKYRATMDNIDKALKAKSSLYNNTAKGLESITQFTNTSAGRLSNAIKNNDDAIMRAKQKADSMFDGKTIDPATLTAKELKAYEIQQLVNKRVQDNIFELRRLMKEHGTARAAGDFAESDKALQDFIKNRILQDKNTYTYLNNLDDPFATTMRAEVQRINMMQRQQIINNVLDDIALTTGKNRADLYVENATSNQEWRALAGEKGKGPNDMDVTVHEYVHSDPSKSVVIDQTIGENALARETYKSYHNGMEASSIEAAKDFTQKVDYTYVSPWMNQGNKYEIEWNPEAFYDLKQMIDPNKYGEALEGSGLDKAALEHKVNERITTAEKCEARADSLQAEAENLVGAEREAAIAEAEDLYCRSYAERVEAGRQLGKGKKIIDGRNKLYESEVGQSNVSDRVNEINAVVDMLKEGKTPLEVDQQLRDNFGIDMRGAAKETAQCLI